MATVTSTPEEKTFRAYTPAQGEAYAKARGTYPKALFDLILSHHTSTGGQLSTLVDVGCGPGNAVRPLAISFENATGLDPSPGMLSTAKSLGGTAGSGAPIRFEMSSAEDLGANIGILDGSVDMITAGTAAHWFDMAAFWPRAAALLKPGGTVALWTGSSMYLHPSTPNAAKIQDAMDKLENEHLGPYMEPGNRITRGMYDELPLPWTLEKPVAEFPKEKFFRQEWNRDGKCAMDEKFFLVHSATTLDRLYLALSSSSPLTRWRQAHPELVKTENDVLGIAKKETLRLLHEAGVKEGEEELIVGVAGALIMCKRI